MKWRRAIGEVKLIQYRITAAMPERRVDEPEQLSLGSLADHPPFFVRTLGQTNRAWSIPYVLLKTTSWDFGGDRTDLHDILSCCFSALARARDFASVRMLSEPGFMNPEEISARYLVFTQSAISRISSDEYNDLLKFRELTARLYHLLERVFSYDLAQSDEYEPDSDCAPKWLSPVCKSLRIRVDDGNYLLHRRTEMAWIHFYAWRRGVTVAELPSHAPGVLRALTELYYNPVVVETKSKYVVRTTNARHAVPLKTIKMAEQLASHVDAAAGGVVDSPLVVPLDSHIVVFGGSSLVAIAGEFGEQAFETERAEVLRQRDKEAAVFFADYECVWVPNLDESRFQALVLELLENESGVQRIREVGSVHDRDGGRDFVAEWNVVRTDDECPIVDATLRQFRRVIVQAKVRKKSVNKSDVQDIRDTVEHYGCDGFFLVAYPKITGPLYDHLDQLRQRGDIWMEWWESWQLEARLRAYPDIAARYADIVSLKPLDNGL